MEYVPASLYFREHGLLGWLWAIGSTPDLFKADAAGGIFEFCKPLVEIVLVCVSLEQLIKLISPSSRSHFGFLLISWGGPIIMVVSLKMPWQSGKFPAIIFSGTYLWLAGASWRCLLEPPLVIALSPTRLPLVPWWAVVILGNYSGLGSLIKVLLLNLEGDIEVFFKDSFR